jgi:hypothetical protein
MFELFYFNDLDTKVSLAFLWKWLGEIQDRLKRVASEEPERERVSACVPAGVGGGG